MTCHKAYLSKNSRGPRVFQNLLNIGSIQKIVPRALPHIWFTLHPVIYVKQCFPSLPKEQGWEVKWLVQGHRSINAQHDLLAGQETQLHVTVWLQSIGFGPEFTQMVVGIRKQPQYVGYPVPSAGPLWGVFQGPSAEWVGVWPQGQPFTELAHNSRSGPLWNKEAYKEEKMKKIHRVVKREDAQLRWWRQQLCGGLSCC